MKDCSSIKDVAEIYTGPDLGLQGSIRDDYALSEDSTLSDDHYRKMKIESIHVQEQIMENNTSIPQSQRLLVCMGIKHVLRAGLKVGNDWQKEIRKAINYFFRALTGKWIHESDISTYFNSKED